MKAKDGEKKKAGASCAHKALKLSAKARYALRALIDIASCDAGGSPRTGAAISKTQQVSEKFLSRIVTELRDAGVFRSVRGNVGGFRLAKPPDDITLLEVVEAVQGPVMILDCLSAGGRCSRRLLPRAVRMGGCQRDPAHDAQENDARVHPPTRCEDGADRRLLHLTGSTRPGLKRRRRFWYNLGVLFKTQATEAEGYRNGRSYRSG